MQSTAVKQSEVQVLVTEEIPTENPQKAWRAVVTQMPHLIAEGESREEVIAEIRKLLAGSVRHAEVVTIPLTNGTQEDTLSAKGYRHYGIFENDPEALRLFDEIEEERNKHFVEPVQP